MNTPDASTDVTIEHQRLYDTHIPRVQREIEEFWQRMPGPRRFDGARVLDFGSGIGCLSIDLAERGAAHVTGVEISPGYVAYASERVRRLYPQHSDVITYATTSAGQLPDDSFDVIISKDVLEHVIGVQEILPELARKLVPGGQMLLGFGPLWHSMFGDHELSKHLMPSRWRDRVRIPWLHLIAGETRLVDSANRTRSKLGQSPLSNLYEYGFNQVTYREFKHIIGNCGLTVKSFETNTSTSGLARMLERVPVPAFLQDYWVRSIYCQLERR